MQTKMLFPCATVQTVETFNAHFIHSLQTICHVHMKPNSCHMKMILQC